MYIIILTGILYYLLLFFVIIGSVIIAACVYVGYSFGSLSCIIFSVFLLLCYRLLSRLYECNVVDCSDCYCHVCMSVT